MKIVLFAAMAVFLYALQNVLLEQKLANFNTAPILVYVYTAAFPLALVRFGYLKATGQSIRVPSGMALAIALLAGVMLFFADLLYVGAYTSGGNLMTITTIVVLFPAFASLIRYFWVGGLPNRYQAAGYILAALAVLLVAKGNAIQTG